MVLNHKLVIAVISASAALLVGAIFILVVLYVYYRKSKCRKKSQHQNEYRMRCRKKKKCVSMMEYESIESATDNFKESKILGGGGFGCVYQGNLQPGNLPVAVKRLSTANAHAAITQFQTEVELLSKIEHPNIITLLGYSIHAETRLLVYELMQNGSLETQLHGPSRGSALTWHLRLKIALDVARGLEYLHVHCHPRVIHRDLKSSNILLDSNFTAKVSDFGLAILDGSEKMKKRQILKVSGTMGYVAPEYLLDGKLTDKSDVYAFGVVLLELLLGRKPMDRPTHTESTVSWAMPQLTDRTKLASIVDPVITNSSMDINHLYQVAAVALLCLQPEPSYRPLIADILLSLVPLVPFELGGALTDVNSLHSQC